MTDSVGLSVGATNLAAVHVGRAAVTRPAVLARPAGPALTDFVDRVGDPVAMVAADGSTHHAEVVLTSALRDLLGAVPRGRTIGVSHPANWRPQAVGALRNALTATSELRAAALLSDDVAALTALVDNPGLPARGVVVLCDFGGSGTTVSVADAGDGYRPIVPAVRHNEFSGALLDQAVLTTVLASLPGAVDVSATSAIASLSRLRAECRAAKERLSGMAATAVTVDVPGHRTEVRITRDELNTALRAPLAELLEVVQDSLRRSGIRAADVAAVATVGGGARIPAVTTMLSDELRVPVLTMPQPELAAAIGAGIRAARRRADDGATVVTPHLPPVEAPVEPAMSSTFRALAWSQDADEVPPPEPVDPRPVVQFAAPEAAAEEPVPWYRRTPILLGIIGAVVLTACVAAVVVVMNGDQESTPVTNTTTATATPLPATTAAPAPSTQQPSPAQAPVPQTQAPPWTRTVTSQAPEPTTEAPPPPPEPTPEPAPEPTGQTTAPPVIPTIPTIPTIPPIPTIPGLPPFIPQPGGQLSP